MGMLLCLVAKAPLSLGAFLKPLLGLRFRLRLGALRTQWNRSEYEPSLQAYTFIAVILHAVVWTSDGAFYP